MKKLCEQMLKDLSQKYRYENSCEQNYSDKIYDKICKSFVKNNVNNEGKIDSSLSKGNFRHKYHKCVQQFTLYLSFGWLWGPVKVENTVKIYKPFVPILLGSLAYELHNHACLESDDLGVLIPAKKYSTYKMVKLEKEMLSAILFKLFSDRNTLIFENDECSILKEYLVGFVKARSAPCGHLLPVRKYTLHSTSFTKSAASFRSSSKLDWTLVSLNSSSLSWKSSIKGPKLSPRNL